jgi:hypothetical protein
VNSKLTRIRLAGLVVAFSGYFAAYAHASGANVAYLAWFAHVPMIEKYFAGSWTWRDAIQTFGEHGLFGYNFLLLANVKYFHLNVFFDIYLNALVVSGVGLVVAMAYHHLESPAPRPGLALIMFTPVAFALFSVSQQSSGAMETQVRIGILSYLVLAYWIDQTLLRDEAARGPGRFVVSFVLIVTAVLLFGTLYTFAGFPALFLLCLYAGLTRPQTRTYAAFLVAALSMSIVTYVRFYDLRLDSGPPMDLVERLSLSTRFVAAHLGSATLGRTLWEDRVVTSEALMLGNGLFVSVAYAYAIWLSCRSRLQRVTWMPVLLIAYSVGTGLLVSLGRGATQGWTGGTNYWYAVHVKLALAGCLWIFAHVLLRSRFLTKGGHGGEPPGVAALCAALMITFVACLTVSNVMDWRRAPHVRQFYEAMIPYGLGPLDEMPVDATGQTPFKASRAETEAAMTLFREHGLTFFALPEFENKGREHDLFIRGDVTEFARLGAGWHDSEGAGRWASGKADLRFRSGSKGMVEIHGYLPTMLSPNVITLSADGGEPSSQPLSEGKFKVTGRVPPDSILKLTMTFSKHLVPREAGQGEDQRDLGALIMRISTK